MALILLVSSGGAALARGTLARPWQGNGEPGNGEPGQQVASHDRSSA